MFDLVSTMSNILPTWFSWRLVIRMLRGLYWGVIMSAKTIFIVFWLSPYKIYAGPMGILLKCKSFKYSSYLANMYTLLLFLHWDCLWLYQFVSCYVSLWQYDWRGYMLSWQRAWRQDLLHDMLHSMYHVTIDSCTAIYVYHFKEF